MISKLTINGVDLGTGTPFPIKNAEGFSGPEIRMAIYDRPGLHGATYSTSKWGQRRFRVEGRVKGDTGTEYLENRAKLQGAFDIDGGERDLKIEMADGKKWQIGVIINEPLEMPFRAGEVSMGDYRIEMSAANPYFYSQDKEEVTVTAASGESVINGGNTTVFPVFTLEGPLTGDAIITNVTTNETMIFAAVSGETYSVAMGEELAIDVYNRSVEIGGYSAYSRWSGNWIALPSGESVITLTTDNPGDAGSMTVEFRDAIVGL